MPTQITNMQQLIQLVRTGDNEITLAVTAALAGGITAWQHWQKVREPGHFDRIDAECAEMAGLTDAQVQHLNEDLPRGLKERIRRFFLSREEDVPVSIKFRPDREEYLEVQSGDEGIGLVVHQKCQ